jgi:hypothetical protein
MTARAQHVRDAEEKLKASLYFALTSSFTLAAVFVLLLAFAFVLANRQ